VNAETITAMNAPDLPFLTENLVGLQWLPALKSTVVAPSDWCRYQGITLPALM
jgi:hypothetical protein